MHARIFFFLSLLLALVEPAAADLCTPITGHDCVGNDLFNFSNVPSAAACCAKCTGACTLWKWNTDNNCYLKNGCDNVVTCPSCIVGTNIPPSASPSPSQSATLSSTPSPSPKAVIFRCAARYATLTVYKDATYDVSTGPADGGSPWFSFGDAALHAESTWYGLAAGTLHPLSSSASNGSDAFGTYVATTFSLEAVGGGAAGLPVSLTYACYTSGLVAFNATLPAGANNTATGSGNTPVIHFPSFASGTTALGTTLGWLVNGGIWTLFELWGVGTSNAFASTDGPVWIYNATFDPSTTAPADSPAAPVAAVISPLSHFKASTASVVSDPTLTSGASSRLVIGPLGTATSLPPRYTTSAGIWASSDGINAATFEWGAALQAAYGTRRLPLSRDVLNDKLSYWSDNGAVYFQVGM
jgi:hypothetical protein